MDQQNWLNKQDDLCDKVSQNSYAPGTTRIFRNIDEIFQIKIEKPDKKAYKGRADFKSRRYGAFERFL